MLPWSVACEANWLGKEQSIPTAWEKSAEGILAGGNEPHSVGRSHPGEGLNGARPVVGRVNDNDK